MDLRQKTELDRYAVLKALQDFQHYGTGKVEAPHFPKRRDGGRWIAQATVFDAGYNAKNTTKLRNMPYKAVTARPKILLTAAQGVCAFTNLIPHCGLLPR